MQPWPEAGREALEIDGVRAHRLHREDLYFDHYAKLHHPGVERMVGEVLDLERPDVVHVHHWLMLTGNLVEIAARRGIPSVVTLHDAYSSCPRCYRVRRGGEACDRDLSVASCLDCVPRFGHEPEAEVREGIALFADQMRAELGMARAVVVAADATADLIASRAGFPRERIDVLPLGYRPRFSGRAPAAPPAAGAPFRFGTWGHLDRRKGVLVAIDAMRRAAEARPAAPIALEMLGAFATPALEAELRERARGLPVRFHGPYDYAAIEAAGLHAGLFPATCFETFGLVLDECFELGLPCIVSDLGAPPRRAGGAALVVPAGDAGALAAAMIRLATEPGLRESLAAKRPPPPPPIAAHARALRAIYERARRAPADPAAPPVGATRRAAFRLRRRESGLKAAHDGRGPR